MLKPEALVVLQNLGLEETQIQRLESGYSVAFNLSGATEGTVCVARLKPGVRLQVGIYMITNVGGGLADFMTFESRARVAARTLGVPELELMGLEVNHSGLREVLQTGGFSATSLVAPEELGGGILNALSRIEQVS